MSGEHKIVPRWGQPLTGIIAAIVFTLIAWVTWYIFADPRGPIHKYEQPFLTFLAFMILVGLWQHLHFGDWPFQKLKGLKRLVVETVVNIVASWFIIYVVFDKILGKVMLAFWSTSKMSAITGKEIEVMWESPVGSALTMVVLTGFFTYAFWTILFQKWPFAGKLEQPALGLAEWSLTTVVTVFAYGLMFVPAFMMALKDPLAGTIWWEKLGGTKSPNFLVGIWEWMIVYLFMTANIWAGKPWDLAKKQPYKGLFGLIAIPIMAIVTVKILMFGMDSLYGPVVATAKDGLQSLDYRYYHTATIAGFTLFPFLIWNHFFDNWPQKYGAVVGWLIRTVGVFAIAAVVMFIYYQITGSVFGLESKLSNHVNKPLVWLFWWIIPLLFSDWFAHKWPFYVEENVGHELKGDHTIAG